MFPHLIGPLTWSWAKIQFITQSQLPLSPLWLIKHKIFWVLVSVFFCWYNKLPLTQGPFISQFIRWKFWCIAEGQNQNVAFRFTLIVGRILFHTSVGWRSPFPFWLFSMVPLSSQRPPAFSGSWSTLSHALNLISPSDISLSASLLWWYWSVLSQGCLIFFFFF